MKGPGRETNGHDLTQYREGHKPTSVKENQLSALPNWEGFYGQFCKGKKNEQEENGARRKMNKKRHQKSEFESKNRMICHNPGMTGPWGKFLKVIGFQAAVHAQKLRASYPQKDLKPQKI